MPKSIPTLDTRELRGTVAVMAYDRPSMQSISREDPSRWLVHLANERSDRENLERELQHVRAELAAL